MRGTVQAMLTVALLLGGHALAQTAPVYDQLARDEAAANARPGPRTRPTQTFQVPEQEVSPQLRAMIAGPFPPHMNADPKNAAEWHELIDRRAALASASVPAMAEKLGVTIEDAVIGGVKSFIVTPKAMPPQNAGRVLVHLHGGGYVFGPGRAALPEAVMMAGFGGFKVISVDYRMPPDFPYPAAMDDAMAVWAAVVKTTDPRKTAIFGTSTGGGMTLAMVLRAKAEGTAAARRDRSRHALGRPDREQATATARTSGWTTCWSPGRAGWAGRRCCTRTGATCTTPCCPRSTATCTASRPPS